MPRRSFSRSRVSRAPRRKTVWAREAGTFQLTTGDPFNATAVDLLASFEARYGADPIGTTLLRVRGIYALASGSTAGVPAVVGIRIGSDHDAALTSSEQNPMTNGEYLDWLSYEPFITGEFDPGTASTNSFSSWVGGPVTNRVIDVKAKRKLTELDETIILNMGSDTASETTITGHFVLSMLLALP